jgi:hypothetical protein
MRWPLTRITQRFTCSQSDLTHVHQRLLKQGMRPIFDYAVETRGPTPSNPSNNSKVRDTVHVLTQCFAQHSGSTFALKWSGLGYDSCLAEDIVGVAMDNQVTLLLDAERADSHEATSDLANRWMKEHNIPSNAPRIYKTYQMYRRDTPALFSNELIDPHRKYPLGIKLVRGAYLHEERHLDVLCKSIEETHSQYNEAIDLFARHSKPNDVLMCATHNQHSVNMARSLNHPSIVFAQLMGMHDELSHGLVDAGCTTYKYVPFGPFWDTVPYLVRRAYEHWSNE